MNEFKARHHLARLLACEPAALALSRGPFDGYRGAEADYTRDGSHAGSVLVGPAAGKQTGRGPVRTVTVRTKTDVRRISIGSTDEVAW